MKTLVIVESPAKARKIATYLGSEYVVKSSIGHIRDLPVPSKLPEKIKALNDGAFKRFAVDVTANFEPYYIVSYGKGKTVTELKDELKKCDELLLATDEDREGEAIAWHLLEVLKPKVPVKRMVFHEITKDAITQALTQTRDIDYNLVDAQETRRILDRLFGFQVSPFLWRKFGTGLSAGRVQSATTRLIVDLEKERMAFKKADYATIQADFAAHNWDDDVQVQAKLTHYKNELVAVAKDFTSDGVLDAKAVKKSALVLSQAVATEAVELLKQQEFVIQDVQKKPYVSRPKPPFTTSTLQQAAINRLKISADACMRTAQSLYENGYITYMRTDSPNLSNKALTTAHKTAIQLHGKEAVKPQPQQYSSRSNNAQEAHEAIRPAGSSWPRPDELALQLDGREMALYNLIYRRTLASQMADAKGFTTTLKISSTDSVFSASGTVIEHRGYLLAYDDTSNSEDTSIIPQVDVKQPMICRKMDSQGHTTKPPARYTEASLVRKMEEIGIGRPSTYAATIRTIQDRGYVVKRGQQLAPTWLAFGVNRVLEDALTNYVDYDFTARMEDDLDEIASGKLKRTQWLSDFWFGSTNQSDNENIGLEKETDKLKELIASKISDDVFDVGKINRYRVRVTSYGPFVEDKEGQPDKDGRLPRGYIPLDSKTSEPLLPDELTDELAAESVAAGIGLANAGRVLGKNPTTKYDIVAVNGKYGAYFTEVLPEDVPTKGKGAVKPKTGSLLKDMSLDSVTLADALKVFQLPRELGLNPEDGEKIVVNNGRFGPYLMKMDRETKKYDYRSIRKTDIESAEERMFSVTLAEAIEEYSHPKIYRRGGGSKRK